jgi:hypothetical protein
MKVTTLPFVIPSAAEGSAVRPGFRSKVGVSLVLTHTLQAPEGSLRLQHSS